MTLPLTWLHIGDLHVADPDAQNVRDLRRIVAAVVALPPGSVDFVLLPGDNADNGTAEQYAVVHDAIAPLPVPVHVLPGDHDMEPGSLQAFHGPFGARALPFAETARGCRCLFLDVVSAGTGGPDFRLGATQLDWVDREIAAAANRPVAVFMHTYPADLREGGDRIGALLSHSHVACVDMGHTHYNELANDGSTVFMATRSTGQVEEGPVGFSVAALNGGCVSWRFKPLEAAWPFVLVTAPSDARLLTSSSGAADPRLVRARVLGDRPITRVDARINGGAPRPMTPVPGLTGLWQLRLDDAPGRILVEAEDAAGRRDEDSVDPAGADHAAPARVADGSDADRVGTWPAKGIPGGQLGPNRNGRRW